MSQRIRHKPSRYHQERRSHGKQLLSRVASFICYQQHRREKPCTTARKFIRNHNIQHPCVITVLKISGSEKKFFMSHTGLFSYEYAVENYKLFSL